MPWKGKYSEVVYMDSLGFATVHHNEFFDGLLGEINEEVTINERRHDYSKRLVFQAADMNNDMDSMTLQEVLSIKKSC
jgi:hypothetical protein